MIKKSLFFTLFLSSCLPLSEEIEAPEQKQPFFSSAYVDCERSFSWNSTNFLMKTYRHPNSGLDHVGLLSDYPLHDHKVGTGFKFINISQDQRTTCENIQKIFKGSSDQSIEHSIYQYFDRNNATNAASLSNTFSPIAEKSLLLYLRTYKIIPESTERTYESILELPLTVNCEEKWSVKRAGIRNEYFEFKQPEGKCSFSLLDFEIKLTSGQKVTIALSGYYSKDPEDPTNKVLVEIEQYGFKK